VIEEAVRLTSCLGSGIAEGGEGEGRCALLQSGAAPWAERERERERERQIKASKEQLFFSSARLIKILKILTIQHKSNEIKQRKSLKFSRYNKRAMKSNKEPS